MILYHVTKSKNLESILKNGLIKSKSGMIYLSEYPNSWIKNLDDVVLQVNVDNLKLQTFGYKDLDEIICFDNIEPKRIKIYNI